MITAVTLALMPRYLGAEGMGQYSLGYTFGVLALAVGELGIATLMIKDSARSAAAIAQRFGTAIWLGVLLGSIVGLAGSLLALLLGYSYEARLAIALACVGVPFALVTVLGLAAFQGLEQMRYQAAWSIAKKASLLLILLGVVAAGRGIITLITAYLILDVFLMIPVVILLRRFVPFRVLSFSWKTAWYLVSHGVPYFAAGIFVILYTTTDIILLSLLADEEAVGVYTTPARVFGVILFVPSVVIGVTFPRLTALQAQNRAKRDTLVRDVLRIVVAITIPTAIGVVALSDPTLIGFLGEEFSASGPIIVVLAAAVIPTSILMITHMVLIAADRQMVWVVVMVLGLLAKILLNLALIPLFAHWFDNSALGAAASLLVVEAALMGSTIWLLPRSVFDRTTVGHYGRVIVATAAAAAVLVFLVPVKPLLAAPVAGVIYIAALLLMRAYQPAELIEWARWILGQSPAPPAPEAGRLADASRALRPQRGAR